MIVFGIETMRGMADMTGLDDDLLAESKCFTEPNTASSKGYKFYILLFFIIAFVVVPALTTCLWKVWKMSKDAFES